MNPIPPAPLTPAQDERGLLTANPDALVTAIDSSWEIFIEAVSTVDFTDTAPEHLAPIRQLGTWPGDPGIGALIAEAEGQPRKTATTKAPDEASKDATLAALQRSAESFTKWVGQSDWTRLAAAPVTTAMGDLPLLTALHGASYQQSLALLPVVDSEDPLLGALLPLALTALVDTTGAFAARAQVQASLVAVTDSGTIGTGAVGENWRTRPVNAEDVEQLGPRVIANAATLIGITAGRVDVPRAYRSGDLRVGDLTGLLRWVPVLEHVPGMPAAAQLGRAASYVANVSGFLSKLGLRR